MLKWCAWRLEKSSNIFFHCVDLHLNYCLFLFFYWCLSRRTFNTRGFVSSSSWLQMFSCIFQHSKIDFSFASSPLFHQVYFNPKKIKCVSFLFEVIRFAASFRLVDHIGENHASAQFQIPPMLCIPKFFFLRAGINFNTIFSYFGRFPN